MFTSLTFSDTKKALECNKKADSVDPADNDVKNLSDGLALYGISVATKLEAFKQMFQKESDA